MPQKRARHRFTVDYMPVEHVQIGFEYNPAVGEVDPRATWVVREETAQSPMIHLNTSSDRIGTPRGYQQVSATFTKKLPGTAVSTYASLTYSGFEKGLVFPFGVSWQIQPEWGLTLMNDGRKSHALATFSQRDFYVQLGWIWFKHPAVTVGWGF